MDDTGLRAAERLVRDAFPAGRRVDLSDADDPVVRGAVVRHLLLGGVPAEAGELPALRLTGARITGILDLDHAEVTAPISLLDCRLDEPMALNGARLRWLRLDGCALPGISAANAEIVGGLSLDRAVVTGRIDLTGARIEGLLSLDGARLSGADCTLDGSHLTVTSTVQARDGFVSEGAIRLGSATVEGSLRWCGATLLKPGGRALDAPGLKVGAIADLTDGFTVQGSIRLSNARVSGLLTLSGAELSAPEPDRACLDLRNLVTNELTLLPRRPFPARIDLGYARINLLRDDPATWPAEVSLDGLVYQAIAGRDEVAGRLDWLRLDPRGYRPQAYNQLAAVYQAAGRDDDARAVRYEAERRRQRSRIGRAWSVLQDWTVGYGYKPVRAASWLVLLLLAGTLIFSAVPPRAAEAAKAPEFHASAYTADLLLPVIDLGQQPAYVARGWTAWAAYALIGAGLLFVTTAAAAVARRLQRG